MAGTLVISLDFELMWGVRDHCSVHSYGDAVLGGRVAIPEMLKRFEKAGIRATWATVGLLFARNRREMLDFAPHTKPAYADERLSSYPTIEEEIGEDEESDPFHFGRSLLARILDTEGQEIGTHTYSHYYCLEDGSSLEAFEDDIRSAVAIAAATSVKLKTIVFPRNQMSSAHIGICARHGIVGYRGNAGHYAYRPRAKRDESGAIRAYRFIDSVAPLAGDITYSLRPSAAQSCNIPASHFLRPYSRSLRFLSGFHLARVTAEMDAAARRDELVHLWWHPHNFGRDTERHLACLDRVIEHFKRLADDYGMISATMADLATQGLSAELLANST